MAVADRVGHPLHPLIGQPYLRLASGDGVYVTDEAGKSYLDAVAGVGVMSLGYGRDDLIAAALHQAQRIPYVHSMRFENEAQERLATKLAAFAPPGLNWAFFCSGGSEALDSAVKLVRQYWLDRGMPAKSKVIGRRPSFHGNTLFALSVGFHAARRERYQPYLVDLPHIRAPWIYRCEHGDDPAGPYCDDCSGRALETLIEAEGPETVAAFIAEPIVGAAAPAVTPPPGYYETVREVCDRHDVLFISDEVMTGVGRTGRNLGIEHWDAEPDLMLVAKGISGGYASLAAVVVHDRVIEVMRAATGRFEHNFTMAGNPVAGAVGAAALDAIEREGIVQRVAGLEAGFFELLGGLGRHPIVGDVRGKGLMAGIELVQPGGKDPFPAALGVAGQVDRAARELGLLVYPCSGIVDGRQGDAILLLPPLVLDRAQMGELVDKLDTALERVSQAVASTAA